jgi:hypothetical protein
MIINFEGILLHLVKALTDIIIIIDENHAASMLIKGLKAFFYFSPLDVFKFYFAASMIESTLKLQYQ